MFVLVSVRLRRELSRTLKQTAKNIAFAKCNHSFQGFIPAYRQAGFATPLSCFATSIASLATAFTCFATAFASLATAFACFATTLSSLATSLSCFATTLSSLAMALSCFAMAFAGLATLLSSFAPLVSVVATLLLRFAMSVYRKSMPSHGQAIAYLVTQCLSAKGGRGTKQSHIYQQIASLRSQ
jgi:hypothetical protein